MTDRARQAILRIWKWLPGYELVFVAESSYAALDLLNAVREKVVMVSRLRLDAALYEPASPRHKGQIGRPRKKGKRLPNLTEVIKNSKTEWRKMSVNWYGAKREIEITSEKCVWFHIGKEAVPIRRVIIRDPLCQFETQALLCVKLEAESRQIVEWFIRRWQFEVTFEKSRRHLGIETQRQWSDKAINRSALFIWIVLARHNDGGKVKQRKKTDHQKCCVV